MSVSIAKAEAKINEMQERMNGMHVCIMEDSQLSNEARNRIRGMAVSSKAGILSRLEDAGIYPVEYNPNETVLIDSEKPVNGLLHGYTNGKIIGLNEYVIPDTERYNNYTIGWAGRLKGKFGDLIRSEIITKELAYNQLRDTMQEEMEHKITQMNLLRTKDKVQKRGFYTEIENTLTEYFTEKLPERYKPIARPLSNRVSNELVEAAEQVFKKTVDKSAYQVHKNAKENGFLWYDGLEEIGSYAIDTLGFDDAVDFYKECIENPKYMARKYVNICMNYKGQDLPENRNMKVGGMQTSFSMN